MAKQLNILSNNGKINSHTEFTSFDEAYKYVLHLQTERRNLERIDLLNNIKELMGSDYIQSMKNKNATEEQKIHI